MKVFEIQNKFGFDSLTLAERPLPSPGPGQVLVQLRAVSLNFRDIAVIQGFYNPNQPLPLIPVSDGVGEVVAIGSGVTRVTTGDRVAGSFAQKWLAGEPTRATMLLSELGSPLDGLLAEYAVLHEDGVVHIPDYLSDEEAATLPVAAVTAWHALVTEGGLKAGDTVLLQGTGGVSLFALQFAKLLGARVIITSSSDEKLAQAIKLGADEGINYKLTPDWDERVRELTDGEGVDHVVEVGGAGTLAKAVRAARVGGLISLIGFLTGTRTEVDLLALLMQKVWIQAVHVGHRESFETMNRAMALHQLRPVVERVFPFAAAPEAFEYMLKGGYFGKICLRF